MPPSRSPVKATAEHALGAGGTVIASLACATLIVSPPGGVVVAVLCAAAAIAVAVWARPETLLAVATLVLGTMQLSYNHPFHLGSVTVYSVDLLAVLVLLRAALPRERQARTRVFGTPTVIGLWLWAAVFVFAAYRGLHAGTPLKNVIRGSGVLFYFPAFYFGFESLAREKSFDLSRVVRLLAIVASGLVGWMLLMRVLDHPFEHTNSLGEVVASGNIILHRDFGFLTSFVVYPILALASTAHLMFAQKRSRWALALAMLGVAATGLTLIRGEIFGLIAGLALLFVLSPRLAGARRLRAAVELTVALAVAILLLAIASPTFARAIAERTLPGLVKQSASADHNAQYRFRALEVGYRHSLQRPLGEGFVSGGQLARSGVDPAYLSHSTPTWLLVLTGWPGLIATLAALLALVRRSFKVSAAAAWLHPALISILLMLVLYGLSASSFIGQPWVTGLTALALALRFGLPVRAEAAA
jgi:hypothetical protein